MANHRNPLPIIVPCHRIVGADGRLTGYAGGLERKRTLLDADYSFSTAVGMFQSVIGLVLVVISNKLSAKFTEISIW